MANSGSLFSVRTLSALFIGLLLCGAVLLNSLPLFRSGGSLGIQDWDYSFTHAAAARTTLLTYGQLPLWNPYYCGGKPLLGNPQSDVLSPFFHLILVFGPVLGYKAAFVVFSLIGMFGCYGLGRFLRLSRLGSVAMSFCYMLSSLISGPFAAGTPQYLALSFLPYILMTLLPAAGTVVIRAIIAAAGLTLMFLWGFHYLPVILLFMMVFSLATSLRFRTLRPLITCVMAIVFAGVLSGVKLLPAAELFLAHPRHVAETASGYSLPGLLSAWLDRTPSFSNATPSVPWPAAGSYGPDENSMYIGIVFLLLGLLGLLSQGRKYWHFAVVLALFVFISLGTYVFPSMYSYLQTLPLFDAMRVAQRYRYVFMVLFAAFVGLGFDRLSATLRQYVPRLSPGILLGLVVVSGMDMVMVNHRLLNQAFGLPLVQPAPAPAFTQSCSATYYDAGGVTNTRHDLSSFMNAYPAVLSGYGVAAPCLEPLPTPSRALCTSDPGYRGEQYFLSDGGIIRETAWSPGSIRISAETTGMNTLVVNQNHYPGWTVRTPMGAAQPARDHEGRLAVDLGPGRHDIIFTYAPVSFSIGLWVSFVGVVVLSGIFVRFYLSRRRPDG